MSIKVNESVQAMQKKIVDQIKFDTNTGIATAAEGLSDSMLPAGITADTVKAVAIHNHEFTAAVVGAFAELSTEVLRSNKKLDSTELSLPFGYKDTLNVSQDRSKEIRNPGTGETSNVAGKLNISVKAYVGSKTGQLSTVRKLAEALAAEALK